MSVRGGISGMSRKPSMRDGIPAVSGNPSVHGGIPGLFGIVQLNLVFLLTVCGFGSCFRALGVNYV